MSERRAARLGGVLLALLALLVLAGGALWPLDPDRPLDPAVAGLAAPGSRFAVIEFADGHELAAHTVTFEQGGLRLDRPIGPTFVPGDQLARPGAEAVRQQRFLLGSDRFGRDVAARLLAGGRVSLAVAALVVACIVALGVPLGAMAAIAPTRVDRLLLKLFEALQAFPRLFLLLALAAIVRPGFAMVAVILGATGWVPMARLVRAELRQLRTRDYVLAARGAGASRWRIAIRHLLPNAAAPILVEASLAAAAAIASEAALSFLGYGLQPPTASWGNMVADGREVLAGGWWVALFPGLAVALAALSFNLLGEGIRDALDRRSTPSRS
ncbi:MAG: ABC transporter permease [Thermoanaerobaculia bacterium]